MGKAVARGWAEASQVISPAAPKEIHTAAKTTFYLGCLWLMNEIMEHADDPDHALQLREEVTVFIREQIAAQKTELAIRKMVGSAL